MVPYTCQVCGGVQQPPAGWTANVCDYGEPKQQQQCQPSITLFQPPSLTDQLSLESSKVSFLSVSSSCMPQHQGFTTIDLSPLWAEFES